MKFVILAMCMASLAFAEDKYDTSNIDIDITEVLQNERLLNSYIKCLINKGPCTPDLKRLKDTLPEALDTKCAKCTDRQKQVGKQLVKEVKSKHPEIWSELVAFYDPQSKYQKSFEEFLNS